MHNIVLIITDTFRYDNLGERSPAMPVRTPELDRFAAERASEVHGFYTGSFPTIPHRTDVATGRLGWPHYGWQPLDLSSRNSIATLLGQAGYATQLICDCPHLFNARFQHDFHAAFQHRGQEGDKALLHHNDPIAHVMPAAKTRTRPSFRGHTLVDCHRWTNRYSQYEMDSFPAKTGSTVARWLEENCSSGPFFLWVDLFDPHEPWDPPEYLVRRYDRDYAGTPMLHPNYGRSSDYTAEELRNLRAHYVAEAELVDRWIGRILQKIDDVGLWDNTVVMVTSDHGTSLGEHERTGKTNISDSDDRFWPIYPEVGHVPMLVAAPGVPGGAALPMLGQPVDIMPTLSELAEVTVSAPEACHGRSFADAVRNGAGACHREVVVSASHLRPQPSGGVDRKATTPFVATLDWGYAPVGSAGSAEVYDLRADPLAADNLIRTHRDQAAAMHELFLTYMREHGAPSEIVDAWQRAPERASDGRSVVDYE